MVANTEKLAWTQFELACSIHQFAWAHGRFVVNEILMGQVAQDEPGLSEGGEEAHGKQQHDEQDR